MGSLTFHNPNKNTPSGPSLSFFFFFGFEVLNSSLFLVLVFKMKHTVWSNFKYEILMGIGIRYYVTSRSELHKRNVKLGLWVLASHKQGKMTGYNLRMLFSRLSGSLGDMLSLIALTIPFHSYRFSRVLYALCNLICPP